MRGFTLRVLPVCFVAVVTGCFSTSGSVARNGTGSTPTHAYWRQVNETLSQKVSGGEMKDLLKVVQLQTDTLRALSPDGVDPALVSAVDEVIRCEEEVLRVASLFDNDPAQLKKQETMARAFSDANIKASQAKKQLKGLRDALNARHGGGFAPIGG